MKTVIMIPARYQSSRYPGKPLVKLLGIPMIIRVADICAKSIDKEDVYIVTDDDRIKKVALDYGYNCIITKEEALTGTDRICEAIESVTADIIINVQGDEPLLNYKDINKIIQIKKENMNSVINCYSYLTHDEDPYSVNIPKVITNEKNVMVYMSRNPLPAVKNINNKPDNYKKQVCIYAFTKDELKQFKRFGRKSFLEKYEDIEILRFLEIDKKILMVETKHVSSAVDTPDDVAIVEKLLRETLND